MSRKTLSNILIAVALVALVWGVSALQRSTRAASLMKDVQAPDDYQAYKAMRRANSLGAVAQRRAVPLLAAAEPFVRARAAVLVGETGNARYAPAVRELLRDKDAMVRAAAATALGHLGGRDSVAPLAELAQDAQQPLEVRTAAVRSLALLGAPEAGPTLIAIFQTPAEPEQAALRQAATTALGTVGTEEALQELMRRLQPSQESDVVVRTLAAAALARAESGGPGQREQAVIALIEALRDEASEVRIAAVHSLTMIQPPASVAERARTALQDARSDDQYWVRQAAESALR